MDITHREVRSRDAYEVTISTVVVCLGGLVPSYGHMPLAVESILRANKEVYDTNFDFGFVSGFLIADPRFDTSAHTVHDFVDDGVAFSGSVMRLGGRDLKDGDHGGGVAGIRAEITVHHGYGQPYHG